MTTSEPLLSNVAAQHIGNALASEAGSRLGFLKKLRQEKLSNLRPLSDFFDKNRISFTTSFAEITKRWNYNLQHFGANYLLIVLGLSIYAVVTNWWLLFTIAFIFGGFYLISRRGEGPLTIGGTAVSSSTLYGAYCGGSLILLLFSGATGTIFWIIGAAAIVVLGHAALLEPGLEGEFGADAQV